MEATPTTGVRLLLEDRWRAVVDRLVELSTRLHDLGADAPRAVAASIEEELAELRRTLVAIDVDLERLRSRPQLVAV